MKPETTGDSVHQERDHRGENLSSSTRKLRLVGFFFYFKNSSLILTDFFARESFGNF